MIGKFLILLLSTSCFVSSSSDESFKDYYYDENSAENVVKDSVSSAENVVKNSVSSKKNNQKTNFL